MEDSKGNPSSSKPPSEEEKKPPLPPSNPPAQTPSAPAPQAAPQKPAVPPPPPRPAAVIPPPPPSRPPTNVGRRNFVKVLATVGAILSMTPFIPWGDFLVHSVGSSGTPKRQPVVIDNNPKAYGAAAGKKVNVKRDATGGFGLFPPDSHWVITYPSSGDPTLDAQNPDTFVKFELIRLPQGPLGGDMESAAAFVAFSKVCVHLWCSPNYNPLSNHEQYECPCHGSIYEIPDGRAVNGPASQQPAPTNAIPMLTLTTDPSGQLYVEVPVWDVDHNGVIGYGRNYQSYSNVIKPATQGSH